MAVIPVALGGRSYEVRVGPGLLDAAGEALSPLLPRPRTWVVADAAARAHHGDRLSDGLEAAGIEAEWYEVEAGEAAKDWAGLQALTDWLLDRQVTRSDRVLAFGGGVVGDLTGFACAVLKRGCGFVQLPTTLLAQVDSSVGGKTAINARAGKNLIGAFHQPELVLADTDCLATLPERQMRGGWAEVLKYGALGDRAFFDWCAREADNVLSREAGPLEQAVSHSVAMKARIVAEDEREETGARALLNLGHTFGHALEAATGFSDRLLHGEAVALGMVLAARYSARRGSIGLEEAAWVAETVAAAGLPSEIAPLGLEADGAALAAMMRGDKKADARGVPFILLRAIGEAFVARDVDLSDVAAFLDEQLRVH